jgi:hypothetical protein
MSTTEAAIAASGGSIHEFRKSTRKMRWWYESLADFMVAHPSATQNDIAAHFGRAPATISTIINTDAFKAYYRQRRNVHAEKLDETVRDKLFKVSDKSLDYMLEVLDKKRDTIPLEMLQRITDSSLKNLGYGATPPGAGVTVNVGQPSTVHVAVSLDDLEVARAALRRNQEKLIDVTPGMGPSAVNSSGPAVNSPESPALGPEPDSEESVETFKSIDP